MLDIKFIRENQKKVKDSIKKRGIKFDLDKLLKLDEKKRKTQTELEKISAQKNKASKEIVGSKACLPAGKDKKKIIAEMKKIDKKGDKLKQGLKKLNQEFKELIYQIPNILADDVPEGKDERDNKVIRKWGEIPKFDFQPKDHVELGEKLEIVDIWRASKIAGTRFYYLKKEGALLERALINFAFDVLIKKGFIPMIPPVMIFPEIAKGLGYLRYEGYTYDDPDAYFVKTGEVEGKTQGLYLTGTAEQSLIAMHCGETIKKEELPLRYFGLSTCFRKEAGSYGKDTRGILRAHQFDKVEMISFCKPEDSEKEHLLLLSIEEELMKALKLSYRVVNICTGDLGKPAAKKYDIETWMPGENKYRETHSTSNCTDFQAQRLEIRYKDENNKLKFVHTLNGTAFSMRPIIAIIENYQQKDGSIKVPEALQKYTGFKEIKNGLK